MSSFVCKVLTPQGQVIKVKMVESDKISCLNKLKKNGMTPISVKNTFTIKSKSKRTAKLKKKSKGNFNNILFGISNKIEIEEIKKFTQEFSLLKKSKFTSSHALITIINNTENEGFKDILREILKNVEQGKFMYEAMEKYSDVFPFIYVNFIKMGEISGKFDESLENAINYLENEEELKNKIQKIIIPNLMVFLGIIVLTIISLFIGIPVLQNIFLTNGTYITVPSSTLILTEFISKIINHWFLITIIIAICIALIIKYLHTDNGKYKLDYIKYTNPIFGKAKYLIDFSKLLKTLYINMQNKMRIQDALEVSKDVEKNTYMIDTLEKSINNIYIGKSWLEPFENEKILSPIIIEMLKKSSNNKLIDITEKVIKYVDFEIENQINRLLKILPMISYGVVGIAILIFTVVILIPCIQVYLGGFLFI